ncbi:hypothetical protein Lal_00040936 [Lupinus albus]|uniref:Putative transcription factor C2H2 family n=1 Tax=Lupinus albus TaxID=3870 RepID=A0A6A4PKS3_LUPAL|nr:putative transcription factor C2H2 family [Lupinus albus]KAF1887334.1 hypothetical protein Lal_00040936 [Lupinus albus]
MEEDQQHRCKFCSKSFPCGRSLEGLSSSSETEDKEKVGGSESDTVTGTIKSGYGLRENPNKTWRISDSTSENTLITLTTERFCKECGKGFLSWKALFGHMKCHSDKEKVSNKLVEDQDSVTNNNASSSHNQKLVLDSQTYNEATAPSMTRRRRSKRRRASYMAAANTIPSTFSLSEVEQEQEEVAMSLIMLSRDLSSESSATEFIKSEKGKKFELDYVSALENSEGNRVNGTESNLSKSTITNICADKPSEAAKFSKSTHKRGKFECTTCNKIFHSYQALGGHRASHKRNKNCFVSKNENNENNIDPTTGSMFMKNSNIEYLVEAEMDAGFDNEVADTITESKKSKVHECPICFKIFQSGQALGGHKRSHLASGSESTRNFQKGLLEEPVQEIREFLDLNLPAATEEESTSYADSNRPWWLVENNHNQEALISLMSS